MHCIPFTAKYRGSFLSPPLPSPHMELISTCAAREPLRWNSLAAGWSQNAKTHFHRRRKLIILESGRARWVYSRCNRKVSTAYVLRYRSPICAAPVRADSHQMKYSSIAASLPSESVKLVGERAILIYNNGKMKLSYEPSLYEDDLSPTDAVSEQSLNKQTGSSKLSELKQWWRSVHEVYHDDIATWGVGSNPIFTVYEGTGGEIEKVTIDENEIQRRQGVEPLFPGSANNERKVLAEKKLMLARAMAKDIETGRAIPRKDSTVFTIVKPICKNANVNVRQQVSNRINHFLYAAAPAVKSMFFISMPIYGIFLIWSVVLMRRQSDVDKIQEETSATRLEKMRKLKVQMKSMNENKELNQVPLASSDFMEKILEVREMARQVRSGEASQIASEGSDTVIEYDLEDQTAAETSVNNGSNDLKEAVRDIKEDHVGLIQENSLSSSQVDMLGTSNYPESKTNYTSRESKDLSNDASMDLPTSPSTQGSDIADVQSPSLNRRKPRIITSLEEAKAITAGKKSRFSADVKDRTKYQVADKSMIPSTSYTTSSNTQLKNLQGLSKSSKNDSSKQIISKDSKLTDRDFRIQKRHENSENEILKRETSEESSNNFKKAPSKDVQLRAGDCETHMRNENFENGRTRCDMPGESQQDHTAQRESLQSRIPDDWKETNKIPTSAYSNFKQTENGDAAKMSSLSPTDLNDYNADDSILYSSAKSSKSFLVKNRTVNNEIKDVVGSGQPLRENVGSGQPLREGAFPNTKRWNKELLKRYELERDPKVKELIKEIGSELPTWVTEEEIEQARKMASEIMEGDEDQVQKRYLEVRKKIENERKMFGLEAVLEKYKEYQPKPEDELWWLDLRHVLCLMVVSSKQDGGLYGLDMEVDLESECNQRVKHIIAFEDRKDALNFCRLLEHQSDSEIQYVDIYPFSPKQLYKMAKEEGFNVTCLRMGQVKLTVDSSLEDVEDQILGIGKSVYWEREERKKTIDIDSILHQRFGLS